MGASAMTREGSCSCFYLAFGQICRLFLSFVWGHSFDGETALRSYFSGFVGTVRFPSRQVVLEADRSQQNMVDVKHLLAVTLIKGTVLWTRH
jgi:hypothetical protein